MKEVNICNIQHFSVFDGPGIRSVIFFKGCNLQCRWCHNPECVSFKQDIFFYEERCIGCGSCFQVCPSQAHIMEHGHHKVDMERCTGCLKCCEECYALALVSVGCKKPADFILKEMIGNKEYFSQSGGGVTFSGGECMLQPDGLKELLIGCKKECIHTAVDTAGHVAWQAFEQILPYTDLFLYDIKAIDVCVHRQCTGADNTLILSNFKKLLECGSRVIVRVPYIPGLNDGEIPAIADFLVKYPEVKRELLPYHAMGNSKHKALLRNSPAGTYEGAVPAAEEVRRLKKLYQFNEFQIVRQT